MYHILSWSICPPIGSRLEYGPHDRAGEEDKVVLDATGIRVNNLSKRRIYSCCNTNTFREMAEKQLHTDSISIYKQVEILTPVNRWVHLGRLGFSAQRERRYDV